jgi:hypothetical protein
MKDTSTSHKFPKVQIKPFDGMSITAEVWSQAHEEHQHFGHAHNLFLHGSGLASGLEVVANDLADRIDFVSPGITVDSAGNVIELTEPFAYDFGESAAGTLYLLLGHEKKETGGDQNEICFIRMSLSSRHNPVSPTVLMWSWLGFLSRRIPLQLEMQLPQNHSGPRELDLRVRNIIPTRKRRFIRIALIF